MREPVEVAVGANNAGQSCNVRGASVDATRSLSFLGLQLLGPLLDARTGIEYRDLPPVPARDSLSVQILFRSSLQQRPSISYQLLSLASCISLHTTASTSIYRNSRQRFLESSDAQPLTLSSYRYLFTQLDPRSLTTIRGAPTLLITWSLALFTRRSSTWPHHWTTRHSSSTCTEGLCQPERPPWTT